ncbi:hypothetical protein G7Y89_g12078 [Cudoniella acicularis]|uniref:Phosphoglycerate mutase n=1 Tax=Cudoniella acicularis TaxID=354080 RepID=A0A8H4VXA3_9HELO|nr:hypothetical protein G7Y89_g12078 [Cudoniella acicularis]
MLPHKALSSTEVDKKRKENIGDSKDSGIIVNDDWFEKRRKLTSPPSLYLRIDIPEPLRLPHKGLGMQLEKMEDTDLIKATPKTPIDTAIGQTFILPQYKITPAIPLSMSVQKPKVTFHLLRHGQATHNIRGLPEGKQKRIHDPPLTSRGMFQCTKFRNQFPHMSSVKLVLCSPLQRTLQTAMKSFKPLVADGLLILPWNSLREWGNIPCNTGTPFQTLKEKFREFPFDLTLMKDAHWEMNKETSHCTQVREAHVNHVLNELQWLQHCIIEGGHWNGLRFPKAGGPAPIHIVLVTHWGFLQNLVGLPKANRMNNKQVKNSTTTNVVPTHSPQQTGSKQESQPDVLDRNVREPVQTLQTGRNPRNSHHQCTCAGRSFLLLPSHPNYRDHGTRR